MNCPHCDMPNPEQARFCLNCGAQLAAACPQCGTPLPPQARFCFACGAQLAAAPAAASPPPQALAERLARLVPREFAERLLATRGQLESERRLVTILFSDVKGSTAMAEKLDPEDGLEIMNGAFDVLIEPIYRHEGTLARLMGDAILAFFGAPISHEDDAERACRAALDIVAGAQAYAARLERERGLAGFNVRVGLNTGLVVVGEVGSDLRVEYTAMGDAINLAARMEQNAPAGGVLISQQTYQHVRGVFEVEALPPVQVKGKAEPVNVYRLLRAKPRAFRKGTRGVAGVETRMIGRAAELQCLQDAFFATIEDGELQMVTVTGEAGLGKSRLLYEFDVWAEDRPEVFWLFKGRANQEMQALPYALLRDAFSFRFEIQDSDPPAAVRDKLERGVGTALGESQAASTQPPMRAHFIGHLLGFDFGAADSPHLKGILDDARQVRERGLAYIGDYFRSMAAQSPVLILLEDIHWADDSSLDTLNQLAAALAGQPLLIVCAARPTLFERRPHWSDGQAFHTRVELRPLSKRDSRRLVNEVLQKADNVPAALRDVVVDNAEGNPFYVEELITMLIENGVIVRAEPGTLPGGSPAGWRVETGRLTQVRVPPTLTAVLQARLDRLPPKEKAVLQQASVIGRVFWDNAVAFLDDPKTTALPQAAAALGALREREMVFQREASTFAGMQEYVFRHALLRDATYESVLKQVRRAYHACAAEWLIVNYGDRVGEITGLIAEHLERAGQLEQAADYLRQAGEKALATSAYREAAGFFERALALLPAESSKRVSLLIQAGEALRGLGKYAEAKRRQEEGLALAQSLGDQAEVLSQASDLLDSE